MRAHLIPVLPLAALVLAATAPGLVPVKTSTKSKGATTITWESSFQDLAYELGQTAAATVHWTVDSGAATFDSLALKRYTPRSKRDPVLGSVPTVAHPGTHGATSVDVSLVFTDLHLDAKRQLELGNAHLKLYLWVDKDGDGTPETRAGFGLNVHVEDPQ